MSARRVGFRDERSHTDNGSNLVPWYTPIEEFASRYWESMKGAMAEHSKSFEKGEGEEGGGERESLKQGVLEKKIVTDMNFWYDSCRQTICQAKGVNLNIHCKLLLGMVFSFRIGIYLFLCFFPGWISKSNSNTITSITLN